MMSSLIVLEGSDGSGKATQTTRLYERLQNLGVDVIRVSFPNYESESSALIKMYLRGDFGATAEEVNPYAAATFYAVDRFASFQSWKDFYAGDGVILADRYVGSNMAHQSAKIRRKADREKFLNWLDSFEYKRLKLPRPDLTIFLDMPPKIAAMLRRERGREDIHESDAAYMLRSYNAYKEIAEKFQWKVINCASGNFAKSAIDIHEEIFSLVEAMLIDNDL
ncbi:MAG: deoxynucleoside kinase [Selenomonadaceae bacterium]|nr:deoxynucleoside kinase [Selenomonadaceae bacterium]